MDNKSECRGKWFLIIIGTCFRVVKFLAGRAVYLFRLFFGEESCPKCM